MLYVLLKLRKSTIQCFKRCAIQSFTAIGSWSLQAEGKFRTTAKSTLGCENVVLLLRKFRIHFAQCRGVLLKLPDICDRNFEIFYFRYLMSKSPNSPCNPPIIGFLSLKQEQRVNKPIFNVCKFPQRGDRSWYTDALYSF